MPAAAPAPRVGEAPGRTDAVPWLLWLCGWRGVGLRCAWLALPDEECCCCRTASATTRKQTDTSTSQHNAHALSLHTHTTQAQTLRQVHAWWDDDDDDGGRLIIHLPSDSSTIDLPPPSSLPPPSLPSLKPQARSDSCRTTPTHHSPR